jgi:hypothetical protein
MTETRNLLTEAGRPAEPTLLEIIGAEGRRREPSTMVTPAEVVDAAGPGDEVNRVSARVPTRVGSTSWTANSLPASHSTLRRVGKEDRLR